MFKRRQWIKVAENIILFSVLYLIFWCHLFCFLGVNMGWDANSLSARMLHLLHLDVFIRFYRVPTKMNRNSVCPRQVSNFCGLDKSRIPPVYLQLLTTLYRPSWAAVHNTFFLSVFSLLLYIFRWSRSDNYGGLLGPSKVPLFFYFDSYTIDSYKCRSTLITVKT